MKMKHVEAWDLVFKEEYDQGAFAPIHFFSDQKVIRFELFPSEQFDEHKIMGGKINRAYSDYVHKRKELFAPCYASVNKSIDSLRSKGLYESEDMKQLYIEFSAAKSPVERVEVGRKADALRKEGKDKTPAANNFDKQLNKIRKDEVNWRYDYIRKNDDLMCFSLILDDLSSFDKNGADIKDISKVFPRFAKKYPKHPYTAIIAGILEGGVNVKLGGHFVDFTLPDLAGDMQTLSELIRGKIAVIDLWSSWCGPCIANSRTLINLYNNFHHKGFTIIGVAGEKDNTDAMKYLLAKEQWPWINLVELDKQNHIWDKYDATSTGGKTFLVDQKGIILAINPTADEIREKLIELL